MVRVAGEGDSRVEARFARHVDPGNAAFEFVASGGGRFPLTFVAIAPVIDPRDGTLAVWLVPAAGTKLQPGLTGRVVVTLPGVVGASVVPARAVALSEGKAYVVARRDGKPEKVPVEVIASSGAEALVIGVATDEEVAADAALAEAAALIQAIVRWSVRHRVLVVGTTLALMVVGALIGVFLKFDALPDTTNNQVLVLTRSPGLTPEEVERLVTRPVEVGLGGLPGLVEQRSLSRYGISSVTAVFEDGVDPYRARQMVQERLTGLVLPARASSRRSSGPSPAAWARSSTSPSTPRAEARPSCSRSPSSRSPPCCGASPASSR